MIQRFSSLSLGLLCICLSLQGCQSVKKTLGIDRTPPNEYVVTPSVEALEMPPDFSCLPTPMPGCARPQDEAARQSQEEKFLGAPKPQESFSPGQAALLEQCGAQRNQPDVRHEINTEAQMEKTKEKTIVERLGIKKGQPKGEALNPYKEKKELKTKGIPTRPTVSTEPLKTADPSQEN